MDSMNVIRLAPPSLMLRGRVAPSRSMEAGARSLPAVLRDACNADCASLSALHAPQDEDLDVIRTKENARLVLPAAEGRCRGIFLPIHSQAAGKQQAPATPTTARAHGRDRSQDSLPDPGECLPLRCRDQQAG